MDLGKFVSRNPVIFLQRFGKDGSKGTFSKVSNFGKDKPQADYHL